MPSAFVKELHVYFVLLTKTANLQQTLSSSVCKHTTRRPLTRPGTSRQRCLESNSPGWPYCPGWPGRCSRRLKASQSRCHLKPSSARLDAQLHGGRPGLSTVCLSLGYLASSATCTVVLGGRICFGNLTCCHTVVCWLLNVPATCQRTSVTNPLRELHALTS